MADYSDLIARLEKAEGPDRTIDVTIAIVVGGWRMWKSKHGYWNIEGPKGEKFTVEGRDPGQKYDTETGQKLPPEPDPNHWADDVDANLPEWTASLDAAIALTEKMLPGWAMAVDATVPEAGIDYSLYAPTDPDGTQPNAMGRAFATTLGDVSAHARALLIATLKALQSLEQKDANA